MRKWRSLGGGLFECPYCKEVNTLRPRKIDSIKTSEGYGFKKTLEEVSCIKCGSLNMIKVVQEARITLMEV